MYTIIPVYKLFMYQSKVATLLPVPGTRTRYLVPGTVFLMSRMIQLLFTYKQVRTGNSCVQMTTNERKWGTHTCSLTSTSCFDSAVYAVGSAPVNIPALVVGPTSSS